MSTHALLVTAQAEALLVAVLALSRVSLRMNLKQARAVQCSATTRRFHTQSKDPMEGHTPAMGRRETRVNSIVKTDIQVIHISYACPVVSGPKGPAPQIRAQVGDRSAIATRSEQRNASEARVTRATFGATMATRSETLAQLETDQVT